MLLAEDDVSLGAVRRHWQTGSTYLVAERSGVVAGVVRTWEVDGSLVAGSLAATVGNAGRALVEAAERLAQDRGLRWVRIPFAEECGVLPLVQRWGYQLVSRERRATAGGTQWTRLVGEKRLRLLTVRPARRGDEDALEALGITSGLPSVTVAVDGERIVGAGYVMLRGQVEAELILPVVAPGYESRGLEAWVAEVAARTLAMAGRVRLMTLREPFPDDLGARGWHEHGPHYVRELGDVLTFE